MKLRDKIIFSSALIILLVWFLYSIKSILTPFVAALIIAYLLDPLVDRLKKLKISRGYSAIIILSIFLLSILGIGFLIVPLLYKQFSSLINSFPEYYQIFGEKFYPKLVEYSQNLGFQIEEDYHAYLTDPDLTNKLLGFSGNIFGNIMESSIAAINVFGLIFVTPIIIFYMLKDWDLLIKKIDQYLPSNYAFNTRKIFKEMDETLSGWVHGQFNVCLILGIVYAIGLTLSGLDFGFLIGFLTGIMSLIPFVGMLVGVVVAVIVGLFQWGFDLPNFAVVAVVFTVGQILESNFLTPKLVGKKVGLHPVWIIFGLFTFGVLFGFVGVLLAVPLTAICGVLIKFIALEYKKNFVR